MRKALVLAATAVAVLVGSVAPAQAAPPKLVGCNDREALINFESPWACDFPS